MNFPRYLLLIAALVLSPLTALTQDDYGKAVPFELIDSHGKPFSSEQLQGKTWIASFVFTRCSGPCPQVSATMARLQSELADVKDLKLVTFTVDPERDNPEELTRYAANFRADPERWVFLTGKEEQIHQLMVKKFLLGVKRADQPAPGQEFAHATKLAVVDSKGNIRGYFQGLPDDAAQNKNAKDDFEASLAKLKSLVANIDAAPAKSYPWYYPSPALNAALNGLAGCFLLAAYIAIKAKKPRVHGSLMVAALITSAVFLASYLTYHLLIKDGIATRFGDAAPSSPSSVRYLYYTILTSHTILAILVTPMALYAAWLAASGHFARHKVVARVTFPIWLYVSITGVVVYWMLYQLPAQTGWNLP